MEYITVNDIAKNLKITVRTVQKYCNSGLLTATKDFQGKQTYLVKTKDYLDWKSKFYIRKINKVSL